MTAGSPAVVHNLIRVFVGALLLLGVGDFAGKDIGASPCFKSILSGPMGIFFRTLVLLPVVMRARKCLSPFPLLQISPQQEVV